MFLILLFTLMTVAITPIDEQLGEDDIPFLEIAMIYRMMRHFFSSISIVGFEFGWGLAAVRLEYLRGHIGEKRFAEQIVRPNILFILRAFLRRLLIVPSFPCFLFAPQMCRN